MDIVARAENELLHFRVPAMRLMAEMGTRFEQLTHRKIWHSHLGILRLCPLRGM
jgi:hypothetical protein